jgi:hypothetical protein
LFADVNYVTLGRYAILNGQNWMYYTVLYVYSYREHNVAYIEKTVDGCRRTSQKP